MANGFIKGLLVGGAAAAAGYAGYKMLNENQKKEVNRKVADATDSVIEYILDAEAIASATFAAAKAKAEDSLEEAGLEEKFGALKDQAEGFVNQAMDKAQSFKNDAELAEAVTEADILLDASDLVAETTTPEKVEVVVLEARPLPEKDIPETELKATAKEQVKSLAKSNKKPLSESKKQGLAEETEDKNKSAAKSKSTKKSSSPKKKSAKSKSDALSKSDRPALSKSEKSLADTDKKGLADKKSEKHNG